MAESMNRRQRNPGRCGERRRQPVSPAGAAAGWALGATRGSPPASQRALPWPPIAD